MSRVLTLIKEKEIYRRRFPIESSNSEREFQRKCMKANYFEDVGTEDMEFLIECKREMERYIKVIYGAELTNRIRDMREAIPNTDD